MGWEKRKGRLYYYRKRREGGRVTSEYLGTGPTADLFAEVDGTVTGDRLLRRAGEQADAREARAEADAEADWFARGRLLADAALLAAGFHQHKRQWRRRRAMGGDEVKAAVPAAPPATFEEFRDLVQRAQKGDHDAMPAVRAALRSPHPEWREWFIRQNNPAAWYEALLADQALGDLNLAPAHGIPMRLSDMRRDLEGPNPTGVEKVLAERAALCWLRLYLAEVRLYAGKDLTFKQADLQLRKVDRYHRHMIQALVALARVRRLAVPVLVQMNVAGNQQVNVGAPADAATGPPPGPAGRRDAIGGVE